MSTMRQEPEHGLTYADLFAYPEGQRWELHDGMPMLQAAPSWQHQFVAREILSSLAIYLKGKPCQVFASPFDVLLLKEDAPDDTVTTVVQPDLSVVCDLTKLKKTGYSGIPLLVVEIVSPNSVKLDMLVKYRLYERAGVKSYWVVQPEARHVMQHHLSENGTYALINVVTEADVLTDPEFPDLEIPVSGLFPPLPQEAE